jgi:cysteine desulfurase/selenocysteine lyase
VVRYVPVLENGTLDLDFFHQVITKERVVLFVCAHVSNALGTRNPVEAMAESLKHLRRDAKVLIDGAQGAPHLALNFDRSPFDFYALSAHKMLGPMGIGAILIKRDILEQLPPFLFGGGMINEVKLSDASWSDDMEDRFTAGTPDVAGLVGWAAACEYLATVGMKEVEDYDQVLVRAVVEKLSRVPEVQLIGLSDPSSLHNRVGAVSFLYREVHAHDVGQIHVTFARRRQQPCPRRIRPDAQAHRPPGSRQSIADCLHFAG